MFEDEVDYKNLKIVCQKCGKTGIIDTTEYQSDKSKFFRRCDYGRRGREFGEPQIDYWLCADCLGVETKR